MRDKELNEVVVKCVEEEDREDLVLYTLQAVI